MAVDSSGGAIALRLRRPLAIPKRCDLSLCRKMFMDGDNVDTCGSLVFGVVSAEPSCSLGCRSNRGMRRLNGLRVAFGGIGRIGLIRNTRDIITCLPNNNRTANATALTSNGVGMSFDPTFARRNVCAFTVPTNVFAVSNIPGRTHRLGIALFAFAMAPLRIIDIAPRMNIISALSHVIVRFGRRIALACSRG